MTIAPDIPAELAATPASDAVACHASRPELAREPLAADVTWPSAERRAAFDAWFAALDPALQLDGATLVPASADASFRRYLRVQGARASHIVMDAPPPQEDVRPFVRIAGLIRQAGLHAPAVLAADEAQGFLLLEDLGNELYLDACRDPQRANALMRKALAALLQWQLKMPADDLPPFSDTLLRQELALFPEWCVQREFGVTWTERQQAVWNQTCDRLVASALAQPQVAVHRDWMPRNLMVCSPGRPGILDFQDAVRGPLTYDLACQLRDAFIDWDEAQELDWAVRWWQQARAAGAPLGEVFENDFGEFWRALEWMGLQRHLKVLGIFCRLKHRDGKPRYATDLPRFFQYTTRVAMRYAPLRPLLQLLEPLSGQAVEAGYTF